MREREKRDVRTPRSRTRFSCTSYVSPRSRPKEENLRYLFDNSISYENQADVSTSLSCTEAPSPCTHPSFSWTEARPPTIEISLISRESCSSPRTSLHLHHVSHRAVVLLLVGDDCDMFLRIEVRERERERESVPLLL